MPAAVIWSERGKQERVVGADFGTGLTSGWWELIRGALSHLARCPWAGAQQVNRSVNVADDGPGQRGGRAWWASGGWHASCPAPAIMIIAEP